MTYPNLNGDTKTLEIKTRHHEIRELKNTIEKHDCENKLKSLKTDKD